MPLAQLPVAAGVGQLATLGAARGDIAPYRVLRTIAIEGAGGWDYLTLDAPMRRLYITRGNHVMVVDPNSGALVSDLTGMQAVHGVALAGARAYISDGGANAVIVIDRRSLRQIGRIAAGQGPDGILYDAYSHRIFAFNGRGSDVTAIDVDGGKVVGTVALGGKPEAAVYANSMLAVSDTRSARLLMTVPIGAGVDSNRFDAGSGLIFSSNGIDGTLTVIHESAPDRYTVLQNVPTMRSARTMELDPTTHRIYLVGAQLLRVAPTPAQPRPRPTVVPGTFRLLILGQ